MAQGNLDFGASAEPSNQELAGAQPIAMNVLVDGRGAVRRRPGLATYASAPSTAVDSSGISGIFESARTGELYAVGNQPVPRRVYRVNGGAVDLTTDPADRLYGTGRPVFAETDALLVIAGGTAPIKVDTTTYAVATLGGPPPNGTHIIANAFRLAANSSADVGRWRYSYPASGTATAPHELWPASFYQAAAARPDPILALGETTREVWAFGGRSTQIYLPDATTVYAPVYTIDDAGISAPYSILRMEGSFAWFSDRRRIVVSDGRSVKDLAPGFAGLFDSMTTVEDAYAYRVTTDQFDCAVWCFPSENTTLCLQIGGGWSRWASSDSGGNWTVFPVLCATRRTTDGVTVAGLSDGRIVRFSASAGNDLDVNIRALVRTGFVGWGTDVRKQCRCVRLAFKGTANGSTSTPAAFLRWRDDAGGAWEGPVPVYLGSVTDRDPVYEIRSLGTYRRRQWELEFSGSDEFVLVGASEEYDVLTS